MENELALLDTARKFDRDALVTIFDTYAPAIYRYALRFCHDPLESDSIVGNVFSSLLNQVAVGKGPSTSVRSHLYEITYHFIVDHTHHNKQFIVLEATVNMAIKLTTSSQTQIEERVLMESLVSVLKNSLNQLEQHVIILRFLEGFSVQETATIISRGANHVREIQKCGIAKLRKSLRIHFEQDKQDRVP